MSIMITLLAYTPAWPHECLKGRIFFAAKYGKEASALFEVVKIARSMEKGGFKENPKCEILVEGSSLDSSTYRMPYSWREHIWNIDHAAAIIHFLEIQAALRGPHDCRCGDPVQLTTEHDFLDALSGYQWGFGVCDRCKSSFLAFGDPADNVFVQSKIEEYSHLLDRHRFNALQIAYKVGFKGALFVLPSPPSPK